MWGGNLSFIPSGQHPNYTFQQWTGTIVLSLVENLDHQINFAFTLKSAKSDTNFLNARNYLSVFGGTIVQNTCQKKSYWFYCKQGLILTTHILTTCKIMKNIVYFNKIGHTWSLLASNMQICNDDQLSLLFSRRGPHFLPLLPISLFIFFCIMSCFSCLAFDVALCNSSTLTSFFLFWKYPYSL